MERVSAGAPRLPGSYIFCIPAFAARVDKLPCAWPCRCHADYFILHGMFRSA